MALGAPASARGRAVVRCEWGRAGLAAFAPSADVVIIVDVLSFATCVAIAVSRGATVLPFGWRDARASAFAARMDATLAGPRDDGGLSLSPASMLGLSPGTRVVLPSPNGAALSLVAGPGHVLAGCLRNATAVARAAAPLGRRILVLPAGEQWPDGSLRPSLEDWLGAGAILDALADTRAAGALSVEAEAARTAARAAGDALPRMLRDCASGQELVERGYAEDVRLAAERDVSDAVPVLRDGAYDRLTPGPDRS